MLGSQVLTVLDEIPDTGEIVIHPHVRADETDELVAAWRRAHDEAGAALALWRSLRTRDSFSVFRAAEDRADAAQDALAAR